MPSDDKTNVRLAHHKPAAAAAAARSSYHLFVYAAIAGTCGALSSVVGKLAMLDSNSSSSRNVVTTALMWLVQHHVLQRLLPRALYEALPLLLRGVLLLVNLLCTAQMWRYYVKSLALGPTPVCQIVNMSVNFAVSALAGMLLFGERVTPLWFAGAAFVVAGLGVIVTDPNMAD